MGDHQVPRQAYLAGKGVVRILDYRGNGRFMVLTSRDERILVPRWRLEFKKGTG